MSSLIRYIESHGYTTYTFGHAIVIQFDVLMPDGTIEHELETVWTVREAREAMGY